MVSGATLATPYEDEALKPEVMAVWWSEIVNNIVNQLLTFYEV